MNALNLPLRDEEETNVPILRRIWIRFQGASMGAYLLYVLIGATPKTDSKTSKIGAFVSSSSLSPEKNGFWRVLILSRRAQAT